MFRDSPQNYEMYKRFSLLDCIEFNDNKEDFLVFLVYWRHAVSYRIKKKVLVLLYEYEASESRPDAI